MSITHESGRLERDHHYSHRHLLAVERAERAPHAQVDAVIVPASRPVESLGTALRLARLLGCVLVTVCSKRASADDVVARAHREDVSTVAIDVDEVDDLPTFKTSTAIGGTRFAWTADQSRKRNLGLLLARIAGWRRIIFLDDDMDDLHPSDVRAAAGLLETHDVVGFVNEGFADNSVVCRAARFLGRPQDQFIGAGALVVSPQRMETFFPDLYNEDWFFFLGASRMAVTGSVWHRSFGGAMAVSRARQEELGDCLGEGLFWALDVGMSLADVDLAHWKSFLHHRLRFIDGLNVLNESGPRIAEVAKALDAAYDVSASIACQPDLCESYLRLWHADLATWRSFIEQKPVGLGLTKALVELGWYGTARLHLLPWHEEDRLVFRSGRGRGSQ